MTDSELASKAQGVARSLTYNDDTPQAEAKHLLLACAHRLDTRDVRVHKKADGLLLVSARGSCRYATWRERLAYWIAGTLPREV